MPRYKNRYDEPCVQHETLGAINETRQDRCARNGIKQEKSQGIAPKTARFRLKIGEFMVNFKFLEKFLSKLIENSIFRGAHILKTQNQTQILNS